MATSPPSKRRRGKENSAACSSRKTPEVPAEARQNASGLRGLLSTPATNGLCTAMTETQLASAASVETIFPSLADIMGCSRERLAEQTFDGSTSPRLSSRLARRPKAQFPYALQPFRIMPAPPGEDSTISVSEANRRLQQAQALSERQQRFGQLIDLASTGYIPPRQCGQEAEDGGIQEGPAPAMPEGEEARGQPGEAEPQAHQCSPPESQPSGLQRGTAANSSSPPSLPLQRLVSGSRTMTLQSTQGRGCIRIARLKT